ncbi:MAG: hypothetical protein R2823_09715 [Acidimicrobiia bacterium]
MSLLDDNSSTVLWIALVVPLVALWIAAFWDLARGPDLGVIPKVLWGAAMVITTYIGIAAYFAVRPIPDPPGKAEMGSTPRASAIVSGLEDLVEQRSRGAIDDGAYAERKAELLGLRS